MQQLYLPFGISGLDNESVGLSWAGGFERGVLYRMKLVEEGLSPEDVFLFQEPLLEVI